MEFGTRRAQRNGCGHLGNPVQQLLEVLVGPVTVRAGKLFDIPVLGTHAHALVQVYGDDYKAFKAYAETHRNVCLPSGIPMIRYASEFQLLFKWRVRWEIVSTS